MGNINQGAPDAIDSTGCFGKTSLATGPSFPSPKLSTGMSHHFADQPVKFAVIGCGLIGRKRINALSKIPAASVRCACDVEAVRAADAAQMIPGCAASTDY